MQSYQILSRRNSERRVNFGPAPDDASSPDVQLRRLSSLLNEHYLGSDNIQGCDRVLDAYRELTYRKIFTGTTHEQFLATDKDDPEAIDWLIAVHAIDAEHFQSKRKENRAQ